MKWWILCMRKYADFSGRARRMEFWMFTLFSSIFTLAAVWIDYSLGTMSKNGTGLLSTVFELAILVPTLAVTVRRLHDVGRSGWWYFIGFIPIIGMIWLLVLTVTDGNPGDNPYGPDPKASPA